MFTKCVSVLLATLLLQIILAPPVFADSKNEDKQAQVTHKVKAGIAKLGVGPQARVDVRLLDRTKLAGYVSEIRDESFTVTNKATGVATSVAYADVSHIKGHHLSTGAKIAIGIGIGVAVIAIVGVIVYSQRSL
jgi:hypothetical protein